MESETARAFIFVAVCLLWVAPFAVSSWREAQKERSKANHPTARMK